MASDDKTLDKEVFNILKKYGDLAIKEMQNYLKAKNKVDTGNLSNGFKLRIRDNQLIIEAVPYADFVNFGVKAGTGKTREGLFITVKALKRWCVKKGIPAEAAYAIARKISKFGRKNAIKATPFYDVMFEVFDDMYNELAETVGENIAKQISAGIEAIELDNIVFEATATTV